MSEKHKSCESHCCLRHGCKYGYEDCPVVKQRLEQTGPCMSCPDLKEIQEELNYWKDELAFWSVLNDRRVKQFLAEHRKMLKEKKDVR